MCAAKDLVSAGVRWLVGNGYNISVWGDRWVPGNAGLKIRTPNCNAIGSLTVSSLIDNHRESWNMDAFTSLFWQEDVDEIMRIPVGSSVSEDVRVWNYSKTSHYTVRSSYHLALDLKLKKEQNKAGSNSSILKQDWNFLWNMDLPGKIEHFVWRLLSNSLPTHAELQRRHISNESCCPLCQNEIEDSLHIFRECPHARICWALLLLPCSVIYSDSSCCVGLGEKREGRGG